MRVQRLPSSSEEGISAVLLDDADQPIAVVSAFLRHLAARDYSPNTVVAYAYDLLHFWTFLRQHGLTYQDFTAARSLELLDYLRHLPSRKRVQRLGLTLWTTQAGSPTTRLSAPTLNRIFAAVSSFYDYLIISNDFFDQENPIRKEDDPASQRVSDRHRPFLGRVSRQRPVRRVVHVKTIQRAPRPLSEEQVQQVFSSLSCWRDRAMCWLMLQGGLRPGEVLNLRLEDLQYGRRRITIRHRTDHPQGVRPPFEACSKSETTPGFSARLLLHPKRCPFFLPESWWRLFLCCETSPFCAKMTPRTAVAGTAVLSIGSAAAFYVRARLPASIGQRQEQMHHLTFLTSLTSTQRAETMIGVFYARYPLPALQP